MADPAQRHGGPDAGWYVPDGHGWRRIRDAEVWDHGDAAHFMSNPNRRHELNCAAAPPHWQIGRYRFERQANPVRRWHRWGCTDGMSGVGNYRTPVGAFMAQRRWSRVARFLPPCE